jgi:hypothetical protein
MSVAETQSYPDIHRDRVTTVKTKILDRSEDISNLFEHALDKIHRLDLKKHQIGCATPKTSQMTTAEEIDRL